jgi:hypothetical protein
MAQESPPVQLQGLGWQWTDHGPIVSVTLNGKKHRVQVPLHDVFMAFDRELHAVGCPTLSSVGAPYSVGGFFSHLKHAFSGVAKVARSVVHKAGKAVEGVAKNAVHHALLPINVLRHGPGAITHLIKEDVHQAKGIVRSPVFRTVLTAAAVAVPALAPVAIAIQTANAVLAKVEAARAAAMRIKQGIASVADTQTAKQGLLLTQGVAAVVEKAKNGDPKAQQLVGAFKHIQAHKNPDFRAAMLSELGVSPATLALPPAQHHKQMHPQQPPAPVRRRPAPTPSQALAHRSPRYSAPARPQPAAVRSPWSFTSMGPSMPMPGYNPMPGPFFGPWSFMAPQQQFAYPAPSPFGWAPSWGAQWGA